MFLEKYEPKSFEDFIGNKSAILEISEWVKDFDKNKLPLLIVGPTGSGKSLVPRIISNVQNWQINEISPDEQRDKESLERKMELFVQSTSFFNKRNLFVFEDLDFLSVKDKGAVSKIAEIIRVAKNPIVFTAIDLYSNQKIKEIADLCKIVQLKRPTYLEILKKIKFICQQEDVYASEDCLMDIAKNARGDVRAAILDLDALADIGVTKKTLEYLGHREKEDSIFSTLMNLQKSKSVSEAKNIQDSCNVDYDMQFAWVNENLSLIYGYPELKKAYDLISYADLMRNNIYKRQNWIFLKYYLMAGIILPFMLRNKRFGRFNYPAFISKMSKGKSQYSKSRELAKLVQKVVKGGTQRIILEIPYYELYFKSTPQGALETVYTDSEMEQIEKLLKIKFKKHKGEGKEKKAIEEDDTKKPDNNNAEEAIPNSDNLKETEPTKPEKGKQTTLF
jgi:replication factor C large subunit